MSRQSPFYVYCGGCRELIEGCAGLHADWKHTASNTEACTAGGYARPETAEQMDARLRALARTYGHRSDAA